MRTPSDLPPRDSRTSSAGDRGRKVIIGVATVVAVLLMSARFLAGFYVDYVWHTSVGRGDVFWGVLGSQLFLFVLFALIFIAIAVVNLIIADRLAPVSFSASTRIERNLYMSNSSKTGSFDASKPTRRPARRCCARTASR